VYVCMYVCMYVCVGEDGQTRYVCKGLSIVQFATENDAKNAIQVCVWVDKYAHTYLHAPGMCVCVYIYIYIYIYIFTYIYTHTHIHKLLDSMKLNAISHTYIHTYIHTFIHTYIHVHTESV
jgi:hypothetical protein